MLLFESVQRNGTLNGMVGVYWKGRHYSVYLRDLLQKTHSHRLNRRQDWLRTLPKTSLCGTPVFGMAVGLKKEARCWTSQANLSSPPSPVGASCSTPPPSCQCRSWCQSISIGVGVGHRVMIQNRSMLHGTTVSRYHELSR